MSRGASPLRPWTSPSPRFLLPILGVAALFTFFFSSMEKSSLLKLTFFPQGTLSCYILEIPFDLPEMLSIGVINCNVFREGVSSLKAPSILTLVGTRGPLPSWKSRLHSNLLILLQADCTRAVPSVQSRERERESLLPCKKFVFITTPTPKE